MVFLYVFSQFFSLLVVKQWKKEVIDFEYKISNSPGERLNRETNIFERN